MRDSVEARLRQHHIQPSVQRVAVARYVLFTEEHPCADTVWQHAQEYFPTLSRATVYNTLNLFVEKKLLRQLVLAEGKVLFDPNVEPHHHLIDEESGAIYDIPWESLAVAKIDSLSEFEVSSLEVVLHGKRRV
jgi:Fur family iron response transcriptional regulator